MVLQVICLLNMFMYDGHICSLVWLYSFQVDACFVY